jgi:hypothetical protein
MAKPEFLSRVPMNFSLPVVELDASNDKLRITWKSKVASWSSITEPGAVATALDLVNDSNEYARRVRSGSQHEPCITRRGERVAATLNFMNDSYENSGSPNDRE